jgi:hypothetical protein
MKIGCDNVLARHFLVFLSFSWFSGRRQEYCWQEHGDLREYFFLCRPGGAIWYGTCVKFGNLVARNLAFSRKTA